MVTNSIPDFTASNGASQFFFSYTEKGMMDLILDVINNATTLEHTSDPNRRYKMWKDPSEDNYIKVILHKGSDWAGYRDYDWVIVTAYPVFLGLAR